jgi:transcriptional regulator with AAA-type ATPase domain
VTAVPSRGGLTALADAAASIAPAVMVGLARPLDRGRVSLVYTHANGAGELLLSRTPAGSRRRRPLERRCDRLKVVLSRVEGQARRGSALPDDGEPAAPAGDLHTMERTMIEQALKAARFNKSKAAKALGLTRHQLYVRMRKHGLE